MLTVLEHYQYFQYLLQINCKMSKIFKSYLIRALGTKILCEMTPIYNPHSTNSASAKALRVIIGIWILTCFILAAGYSGTLRSFLISPIYNKPINNVEEVIHLKIFTKIILVIWKSEFLYIGTGIRNSMGDGSLWRRRTGSYGN